MEKHKFLMNLKITIGVLVLLFFLKPNSVSTQTVYELRWITIGEYQTYYSQGGNEIRRNPREGLRWPGLFPHRDHFVRKGMWVAVQDWTDPEGKDWPFKIAHVGAREPGTDEVFPIEFEHVSRFENPEVTVDGFQTFQDPTFVDRVDPSIPSDRMIYTKLNTFQGITVERRVYAFSQEYHDDYHIQEYTLTNTGNVDADPDIELPNQTLTGVKFANINKNTINLGAHGVVGHGTAWGDTQISDWFNDGMDSYDLNFDETSYIVWHARVPGFTEYNNIGVPVWHDDPWQITEGDTVGRLMSPEFLGKVMIHASQSGSDDTNDPDQPTTTKTTNSNIWTMTDGWDIPHMQEEYDWISTGHQFPHHADKIAPDESEYSTWHERMANQTQHPFGDEPGKQNVGMVYSYGPYDLNPGDSIRIVWAEGVQGLDTKTSIAVGREYKNAGGDDNVLIEYNGKSHTKNEWVMTGRDSIFTMFEKAVENFHSGYAIPRAPKPPRTFRVQSGADQITLEWEVFDGAENQGFEIYRTSNRFEGAIADDWQYELVAGTDELGPNARTYNDMDVIRGIGYYYYIQSVGDVNNDNTALTPQGVRLKSNRYYTQTYDPAFLLREPGETLSEVRVVPNPYNLGSQREVRWPDRQDQIAFLEVPGQCTIKIYSERGDLIQTINHTDGSGDEYWNLRTSSNQLVVSGIYLALIEDTQTGESTARKFVIIR